jgi:DNA polymerase-1
MIAAFLLNPIGRAQTLSALAYGELGIEMVEITELIGAKGKDQKTFAETPVEEAAIYASEDADMSWRLYELLSKQLAEYGDAAKVAERMEWPLIPVLGDMECAGVELDVAFLTKFAKQINARLTKLEEQIWDLAGEKFNIASTQQLKVILFDKLKIESSTLKKIKTGVSTAASELEKLRGVHPIIDLLFDYRESAKLKSTYVDALPLLVNPSTGRIHTSYSQTIAQTGRLSSTNPNLQNIPVRTELGREIRHAFVAAKGKVLVAADYSQIELRLAAELADDKPMIEAFKSGIDIHTLTAAEMFGIDPSEVTKDQRSGAKTINFGVLYGMSPHGLSQATGMDYAESRAFIDRYFELRKGVADYIERIKIQAHAKGYTETLFGRRRPCPDVKSNNYVIRSAAERAAVNMPLQGTAADMMKLAMIAVAQDLPKGAHMLLQIHDELIVECNAGQEAEVAEVLRKDMLGVHIFNVPIEVNVSAGSSWGSLEAL